LFPQKHGQTVEEEGAGVLLGVGVLSGGVFRLIGQFLQQLRGLVMPAEGLESERLVEADFSLLERVLDLAFFSDASESS
jgi:hypothetical protein